MCSNRTQLKIRISSMASLVTAEPEYLKQRHSFWRLKNKQATFTERPHGYKPEIILDSNGNEKYICSDCQWILKQPLQSFCGHRYCTDCFNYILRSVLFGTLFDCVNLVPFDAVTAKANKSNVCILFAAGNCFKGINILTYISFPIMCCVFTKIGNVQPIIWIAIFKPLPSQKLLFKIFI